MTILVCASDRFGTGQYRLGWPAQYLIEAGHSDIQIDYPDTRWGIGAKLKGNVVIDAFVPDGVTSLVVQRTTHKHLVDSIPFFQLRGVRVTVDIDDALDFVSAANPAYTGLRPGNDSNHSWLHLRRACQMADVVTVTTPELAKMYRADAVILPNLMPDHFFGHERIDSTEICWPASLPSHPNDADPVGGALDRVARDTGAKIRLIGEGEHAEPVLMRAFGLSTPPILQEFVTMEDWPAFLSTIGIGICPLADTRFNAAKCLDAATPITTRRGVVVMGELREGDEVCHDGKWHKIMGIEKESPTTGLRVTTKRGHSLTLTGSHRLMTPVGWRRADEIEVGDILSMEPEIVPDKTEYVRLPWPSDSRMTKITDPLAFWTQTNGPQVILNETWGQLLGMFVADGSVNNAGLVQLTMTRRDPEVITIMRNAWSSIGLTTVEKIHGRNGGALEIKVQSAHLVRFLHMLGLAQFREGLRAKKIVRVPEFLWRSPSTVVAAFLSGLFEGDGTIQSGAVSLSTIHESLAIDVQRLLTMFGIVSHIRAKVGKFPKGTTREGQPYPHWEVGVLSREGDLFADRIGMLSYRKRVSMTESRARRAGPGSHGHGKFEVWDDEVVSIDRTWLRPVDIQVDGEVFAAVGFVSHNSWLKPLELMSCGVPWVGSPSEDYTRLHKATGVGLLARRPKDWYAALCKLVRDPGLRAEQSAAGREAAENYRISTHMTDWLDVWRG